MRESDAVQYGIDSLSLEELKWHCSSFICPASVSHKISPLAFDPAVDLACVNNMAQIHFAISATERCHENADGSLTRGNKTLADMYGQMGQY
jgi:hypothetical protein